MAKEKPISTFLDFDLRPDKKDSEGFGISRKVAKEIKLVPYVVCPLCGLNRPLHKTGNYYIMRKKAKAKNIDEFKQKLEEGKYIKSSRSKRYNPNKETRFNLYDLKNGPFISLRQALGRGHGIKEVEIIKLSNIKNMTNTSDRKLLIDIIKEIRVQCKKILDFTEDIA
ncbi:MAG TPA: hypothetical protein ENG87_02800 [Candidatus Pacearchaeota archaeon]|nr:hypothetical protein [Candidatus Pacearchaeota archaeon]